LKFYYKNLETLKSNFQALEWKERFKVQREQLAPLVLSVQESKVDALL